MITKINNVAVAPQLDFQVEYNSQSPDGTGRDLAGMMYVSFLPFKYSLSCKWPVQSASDRATLLGIIYGQPNMGDLDIEFLDPITGVLITRTCYVGTPASTSLLIYEAGRKYWSELSLDFIEV